MPRHRVAAMKIAILSIFFTIASVKENEACPKVDDIADAPYMHQLGPPFYVPPRVVEMVNTRAPWTTPLAKRLKAKPYDIEETAKHWWKDHQFLVPIDSEEFPPKSEPDSEILELQTKMDEVVHHEEECEKRITFKEYKHWTKLPKNTWHAFFAGITNCHMYPGGSESDTNIKNLLTDLSGLKVTSVENFGGGEEDGTQFKLKMTFENNEQALFKPIRFDHNYETDPNEFYFSDLERPNAEVVAFYLDKLLGFRRGVPTIIREFNIEDLFRSTPDKNKKNIKYFRSPAKNWCMIGTCDVYCDTAHAICADQKKIRGSVQAWLPLYINEKPSPYSRNYTIKTKQPWQLDAGYCDTNVKHRQEFMFGRRLLDLIDLSVFDFLTGNQDRHSYNWFSKFDEFTKQWEGSFLIHMDNGRGFGTPHFDDLEILAPLTQCCIIRPSTVNTLLHFYKHETTSLGRQLEQELKNQFGIEIDPDRPILARKYFIGIDRRVEIVLKAVVDCVTDAGGDAKQVLIKRLNAGSLPVARERFTEQVVKQELANQFNRPESTHHTEYDDSMIMRHKQDIENLRRPTTEKALVTELNTALEPFLKTDKPCPNEIMHQHLIQNGLLGRSRTWTEFHAEMSNCHLYKKGSQVVENVLQEMKQSEIVGVIWKEATQFQSILLFKDRHNAINTAIFKPMRFGRNYETNPNHFYFDDFDRHHAEIAAFHLDRLLGFRRVPPTVGRRLKVVDDLVSKMQPKKVMSYVSPVGNDCFYKGCQKYCDYKHAFCGNGKMIEGSVRLTLPEIEGPPFESRYKKVYSEKNALNPISSKRTNDDYCNNVLKKLRTHQNSRRLPDLVDLHIFDYLTGNQERDHFNLFNFPNFPANTVHESYIFVTENGKAFGNSHDNDETILAPLTQCCIVRPSTVKTLLEFYDGEVSLGQQLDNSLQDDPLYPILTEKYLTAINFRVEIILKKVKKCLEKGARKVFMNLFQK